MHDRLKVLKDIAKKLSYPLILVGIYSILINWVDFPKWVESLVNLYIFIGVGYCIIGFYVVLYLRIKYIISKKTLVLHRKDNQIIVKLILFFCGICFSAYAIYLLYDLSPMFFIQSEWLGYFLQFVFFLIFLFGVVLIANAILYFDDVLIIDKDIIYLDSEKGVQLKIKEIERVEIHTLQEETKLLLYYKSGREVDILKKYKIKKLSQEKFWKKAGIPLKTD
jgi:hypothetical protein